MTMFDVLRSFLPSLGLACFGLFCLFTAFIPSWRKVCLQILESLSRVVHFGFVNQSIPIQEVALNEKAINRALIIMGSLFVLLGAAGIVWVAVLNPGN